MVVIETSGYKIIESQAALADKGVAQITSPANTNACDLRYRVVTGAKFGG
jgi:hypothetical protein